MYLAGLICLPCFLLPVRAVRTLSIIEYSSLAPALEEPLPKCETTSAGITNSPSAKRAGCLSLIVAYILHIIGNDL